jgi:HD-GYP domain-containing protein (c-di-GMP phosphodiesterase class II)
MSLTLPGRMRRQAVCSRDRLLVEQLEHEIIQMQNATVSALNEMLDLKDIETGTHSTRLAEWATRIGELTEMSEADLRDLEIGAILHDIGKNGVPEAILLKPGKLTEEERKVVEKHSEYGWAILRAIPGFERASLLVLHHHERMDGTGYPSRLKGAEIPIGARIISVVDSFDAMVSDRAYRKGLGVDEAIRRLLADPGLQFDKVVVESFCRIAEKDFAEVYERNPHSRDAVGRNL